MQEKSIEHEERIDEFAVENFKAMGFNTCLPDVTVAVYKRFKLLKDRIHPSRLTPEGFATVAVLGEIAQGKFGGEVAEVAEQDATPPADEDKDEVEDDAKNKTGDEKVRVLYMGNECDAVLLAKEGNRIMVKIDGDDEDYRELAATALVEDK